MRSRIVLALALGAMCVAPIMATNLVQNGSFENPTIINYYECVAAPSQTCATTYTIPAIPGWTVGGTSVDVVSSSVYGGSPQWWSEDGTQGIDMAGTPGPGSLTQGLTTVAGKGYTLSFWVSSNGGPYTNSLTVDWNGTPLETISTPAQGTWQQYSFSVTGTGSGTLAFSCPLATDAGALLDNVSVTTPEPATVGLIGAGLVLIALRFRRRQ